MLEALDRARAGQIGDASVNLLSANTAGSYSALAGQLGAHLRCRLPVGWQFQIHRHCGNNILLCAISFRYPDFQARFFPHVSDRSHVLLHVWAVCTYCNRQIPTKRINFSAHVHGTESRTESSALHASLTAASLCSDELFFGLVPQPCITMGHLHAALWHITTHRGNAPQQVLHAQQLHSQMQCNHIPPLTIHLIQLPHTSFRLPQVLQHHADTNAFCKYSDPMIQLFVSVLFLAGIVGAFIGSFTSKKFGRKPTMMLGGVFFLVGAILLAPAVHLAMLIVGRISMGLGEHMDYYAVRQHVRGCCNVPDISLC